MSFLLIIVLHKVLEDKHFSLLIFLYSLSYVNNSIIAIQNILVDIRYHQDTFSLGDQ